MQLYIQNNQTSSPGIPFANQINLQVGLEQSYQLTS